MRTTSKSPRSSAPCPVPGAISVYAFDPRNGSAGLDRATIVVAKASGRGRQAHCGEEV
jgi:hypothetical protein